MASKVQLRRDTYTNWASNNPTLAAGEQAFETTTGLVKVGDGTTAYTSMEYQLLNTYRLTADRSAIGSAIADYFASAAYTMDAGNIYEIEWELYFTKTTAGTVTFTITTSQTPVNVVAYYVGTAATGVGNGGAVSAASVAGATTTTALPATASLTTAVNHHYTIKALVESNATLNSTIKLQVTESAGTVTPLRGSSVTVRTLPPANIGAFA